MKTDFARELAIKILYKIEEDNGYSNLVLDEYLQKERGKLNEKDIGLISEIVYGTVTWKLTIDTILQKHSNIKINKISKWVKVILRTGIYQIVFLDKIPKSAAVNESVNLCKKYGYKSVGFVNAILRKVDKTDYEELKNIKDENERISKMYSMPEWIVEKLVNQYGVPKTEEICINSNLRPTITIRVNTLKNGVEELKQKLDEGKILWEEVETPDFLHLKDIRNLSNLDLFKEGFFTIQDEGAGKIGLILDPKQGETVLDACSAPGGKTTHLAELMKNKGHILAWDIHSNRVRLVEENAKRLGISIIEVSTKDACKYDSKYENKFDKILLDVPCMGLGVCKRKPDIKWQKSEEEISEITKVQQNILQICSKYLKRGGELVYSTCSILKEENEDIIEKFLEKERSGTKTHFELISKTSIFPNSQTDGFFICKIKKND